MAAPYPRRGPQRGIARAGNRGQPGMAQGRFAGLSRVAPPAPQSASAFRMIDEVLTIDGAWTEIINGWVWDAGVYLGADFEDTDGYPIDAGGAYDIRFLVLPPGSDSHVLSTNDPLSQTPCSQATLSEGSNLFFEIPDPSTPDASSHLWLYWYNVDFDPASGDFPTVPPQTLVPAALATNGTA